MTDIHSHILFDVDDGSRNLEESIELLKMMQEIGFKNIILTPHYIFDIPLVLCRLTSINPLQRNMSLY